MGFSANWVPVGLHIRPSPSPTSVIVQRKELGVKPTPQINSELLCPTTKVKVPQIGGPTKNCVEPMWNLYTRVTLKRPPLASK